MTLSFVASSTWAYGASTSAAAAPALPTGWAAGDLLVLTVQWKQKTATLTTPTGWTLISGPHVGGTGAAYAASAGDTSASTFYKVATAGETAPTIAALSGGSTNTTSGNVMGASISAFRSTSGAYSVVGSGGGQNTSSTSWSVVTASALNLQTGDFLYAAAATASTPGTWFGGSVTATGATIAARTTSPAAASSTTGADIFSYGFYTSVTSGSSNVSPTVVVGPGTSTYGTVTLVRIREVVTTPTFAAFGMPL